MMCTYVSEECWDGEGAVSEAPSLLSYTLRYVSLVEVGTVCQFGLREPMHPRRVCGHFCFCGHFFGEKCFFSLKKSVGNALSDNCMDCHIYETRWERLANARDSVLLNCLQST
jgi:hypothetical protein